jgi:hypothetical protein
MHSSSTNLARRFFSQVFSRVTTTPSIPPTSAHHARSRSSKCSERYHSGTHKVLGWLWKEKNSPRRTHGPKTSRKSPKMDAELMDEFLNVAQNPTPTAVLFLKEIRSQRLSTAPIVPAKPIHMQKTSVHPWSARFEKNPAQVCVRQ